MKGATSVRAASRGGVSVFAVLVAMAPTNAYAQAVPADSGSSASAGSQTAQATPIDEQVLAENEIVVTGYRASLRRSLDNKKNSDIILDEINAEDIADMPDSNLAESLQRIPGISIDRDNGEGRTISVRGLDGGFSRVRINGLEALSTSGGNGADNSPNRSRTFDFNSFASELFSAIRVRKSSSAEADEGSLGATVDLVTGRPFDFKKKWTLALGAEDSYYLNSQKHNPRITGLISTKVGDGRLGFLMSGAYQKRSSLDDIYARGGGSQEYVYRSADITGDELPGFAGFALPTGTTFLALRPTTLTGAALAAYKQDPANYYNPVTNPAAYSELTGSNPEAWAKLHPGCAALLAKPIDQVGPNDPGCNDSLVRIPALAGLNQGRVDSTRIGWTGSVQMEFTPRTRFVIDGLYTRFKSATTKYTLQSIGLNRNNTNAQYQLNGTVPTATAASRPLTDAERRALYPGGCTYAAETALVPGTDCGQALFGNTPVAGYQFTFNPNNRDTFEYYTNPQSPGYLGPAATLPFRGDLVGRNSTTVLDAEVEGNNATYLQLGNMDWRSAADSGSYVSQFYQVSGQFDHEFTDRLSMVAVAGMSSSRARNKGMLVEFNSLDTPGVFTYDARGGLNEVPEIDPGFDVANPANWSIVKGYSAMRHFQSTSDNDYRSWKVDANWEATDNLTFKAGFTQRKFEFSGIDYGRNNDLVNPTEKEAGVSVASLGQVIDFGDSLNLSGNTPTSYFVPNLAAFQKTFDFDCDCINEWGDWRLWSKGRRNSFSVEEANNAAYGQLDFSFEVLGGRRLSGNAGVRWAETEINSEGFDTAGRVVRGENKYDDWLPAGNLTFEVFNNLYVRAAAAKVMARPSLTTLSPQISNIGIPNNGDLIGGTITVGNPKLQPYRGKSFDISAEWYFARGGLISVGAFRKELNSFPQTIFYDAPLSAFLDEAAREQLKLLYPGVTGGDVFRRAFIDADGIVQARQIRDTPGGYLQGLEFSYQQDLTFLPGFLKNFGIQANLTLLESEFQYLIDPGSVNPTTGVVTRQPTWAPGPWLGSSPRGINATIYYETPRFSARVSVADRQEFKRRYPVGTGNCDPGRVPGTLANCGSPLINEFVVGAGTTNVDFAASYKLLENVSITFEALNLTDEQSLEYFYEDRTLSNYGSSGRNVRVGARVRF